MSPSVKISDPLGMSGFLTLREAAMYARLNWDHLREEIPLSETPIPSHLVNEFFAHIASFQRTRALRIEDEHFHPLKIEKGTGAIERVSFFQKRHQNNYIRQPMGELSIQYVLNLLAMIPTVTSLEIKNLELVEKGFLAAPSLPIGGGSLTELNLNKTQIAKATLLQIVRTSTNFKSVVLIWEKASNDILHQLSRSSTLTHLHLDLGYDYNYSEKLDFGILAQLHSLKSLTLNSSIYSPTEQALHAIILSNPELTDLNLEGCRKECLSERNLIAIQKLAQLRFLVLGRFRPKFPASVLNGLVRCAKLEKFVLTTTPLPEGFLDGWSALKNLTHLDLEYCHGSQLSASLLKIKELVNLKRLELLSVFEVNDAIVKSIVDHCLKLEILTIGGDSEDDGKPLLGEMDLTQASLNSIQAAILERHSSLRLLTVGLIGTKITYEMLAQLRINVSKQFHSFKFLYWIREDPNYCGEE